MHGSMSCPTCAATPSLGAKWVFATLALRPWWAIGNRGWQLFLHQQIRKALSKAEEQRCKKTEANL